MTMGDVPVPSGPAGLLLCRDLIFTSKITGTARALGKTVVVAGNRALATAMLERWAPQVVFVDLTAGDLVNVESLRAFQAQARSAPFVAFGPHVDAQALADAAEAGCELVLTRGRFTAELPDLIGRYL